ncbi:unnamed protein product [Cylindrotheca closterium]|uniref:Large ribosomal subunit protein bL21m n=1 Tax=Cylindrotheca closterium TaxID=2856 RepID=A0AAD2CH64_9STRA|nr:unnamed protein product [Cylindrotheca closterium]
MMQSTFRLLRRASRNLGVVAANVDTKYAFNSFRYGQQTGSKQFKFLSNESTSDRSSSYAVIDHSEAYETAMQGKHGDQLALARLEGQGKDDPPFDPFAEFDHEAGDWDTANVDGVDKDLENFDDEEDEYGDEDEIIDRYNADGSVRRSKSVLATLRAGFPAGGHFAVVRFGGAQHKVTTDDLIVVNRLKPVEKYNIGSVHTLTDVMLAGSSHTTLVGMPFVKGAEVDVMVEEITRDGKLVVFKKRRRKNSQRKNGFRRDVTLLRVLDVRFPQEHRDHNHVGRELVDELEEAALLQQEGSKQQKTAA